MRHLPPWWQLIVFMLAVIGATITVAFTAWVIGI